MVGSAAARDRSAGLVIEDNAAMDGRHRTPWPDRPRSSLPSVAWWTGQGNCFEAYCASLKTWTTLPRSQHPGSPPARYRLTPSSPPPITGTGPGTSPAPTAREPVSLVTSSVRRSIRQRCAVVRGCIGCAGAAAIACDGLCPAFEPGAACRCRDSMTRQASVARAPAVSSSHALRLSFALFAASKKPGTGPGSGYCDGAVLR